MKQSRFTKEERHQIYIKALESLETEYKSSHYIKGLCSYIYWLGGEVIGLNFMSVDQINFPELFKHKPKVNKNGDYWYKREQESDFMVRQLILLSCIELTKSK